MLDFSKWRESCPWLEDHTILLVIHGSHAYGTNTPASDLDMKGIAIPPKRYFFGWLQNFEQAESHDPDAVIYDIRKFFKLAADCNPNIIEVLWAAEEDVLKRSTIGDMLRHMRSMFLSQKAKHTFSGYAMAQLKRIKTHRKWLLNPPKGKPDRGDFGLPETSLLSRDLMGAIQATVGDEIDSSASVWTEACNLHGVNVMAVYQKERTYHNALTQWQQYQNWKTNRNPERAEMEIKFGYDTKHAMHLVRLMRMCSEILSTGKVIVKRPDKDELLAIRNGAWKYDKLIEWAEEQDRRNDELLKTTALPYSPDRVYLNGLCSAWVEHYHYGKN